MDIKRILNASLVFLLSCLALNASASSLSSYRDSDLIVELASRGMACSPTTPNYSYRANCFDVFFNVYRTDLRSGQESQIMAISLGSETACTEYGPEMIRKIGRFTTGGQVAYCSNGFLNTL